MAETYPVSVSAGTLREDDPLFVSAHRWTEGGVSVRGAFSGAHLLHVAVGGCVLNDVYREAADAEVAALLDRVEAVAEIPRTIAQGAPVERLR